MCLEKPEMCLCGEKECIPLITSTNLADITLINNIDQTSKSINKKTKYAARNPHQHELREWET